MYSLQSVLYFPVAWSFNLFSSNNLAQADPLVCISFYLFCVFLLSAVFLFTIEFRMFLLDIARYAAKEQTKVCSI